MLRIGKMTDYAMIILGEMARTTAPFISAATLADTLHLSLPTVSKILKILGEAEIVSSARGAEGGYRLTREPANITVAQVINAMEGEFALTECAERTGVCVIDASCGMKENWRKINKMVHAVLDKVSILEMTRPISVQGRQHDE